MTVNEYGSEFYLESKYLNTGTSSVIEDTKDTRYLRSGRDALGFIAENIKANTRNILIPALCCESMVLPFKNKGIGVKFFRLDNEYRYDINDIYALLEDNDAILLMDYFGNKMIEDENIDSFRNSYKNIKIIEDRTHNIFNDRNDSVVQPDYVVASLRKWFALPDGGIACSLQHEFRNKPMQSNRLFTNIRIDAMQLKHEYLNCGDQLLKNKYRELLSNAENYLSNDNNVVEMSDISRIVMTDFDIQEMKRRRKANYLYLMERTKSNDSIESRFVSLQECPLYFPALIKNRDEVQRKLAQNSIYCPVIWPIPQEAHNICENSNYISKHILAIPCDHRYSTKDMEYIYTILANTI